MDIKSVSVAMIAEVTGKQEKTVERWIRKIAPHCEGADNARVE
jgi:transposase-like protein